MWRLRAKSLAGLLFTAFCAASPPLASEVLITAPVVPEPIREQFESKYRLLHSQIAKIAGLETRLAFLPAHLARASHERGEAGAMLGAACDAKRNRPVLYSLPYTRMDRHLISAGENPVFTELTHLAGRTLGVIDSYYYQIPDAEALAKMNIAVHGSKDQKTNLKMLLRGRVDAILAPASTVEALHSQSGSPIRLKYSQTPFKRRSLCYTARDNDEGKLLINKLNRSIRLLHQSGELEKYMVPPFKVPTIEQNQ